MFQSRAFIMKNTARTQSEKYVIQKTEKCVRSVLIKRKYVQEQTNFLDKWELDRAQASDGAGAA